MRRFLDSIIFAALALIDLIVYFALASFTQSGQSVSAHSVQWSSVTVTFFMFPVAVMFFMFALARGITDYKPGKYYSWLLIVFAASAAIMSAASLLPAVSSTKIGASVMLMFFGASAICALFGLILGLTKGIEHLTPEEKAQRDQDAKDLAEYRAAQKKDQAKAEKAEPEIVEETDSVTLPPAGKAPEENNLPLPNAENK